jgi:hypothetical protein
MNSSALPAHAEFPDCRRTNDQTLSDYCQVLRDSSIGSGWKHLVDILAELEALHDALSRGLAHAITRYDCISKERKAQCHNL